jgi:DeoR/GlpR family transcriptional regulator of sugar metabolism
MERNGKSTEKAAPAAQGEQVMSAHLRTEAIYKALQEEGPLKLSDLAGRLSVSMPTIRKDVDALARAQRVERSRGMVRLRTGTSFMSDGTGSSHLRNNAEKARIGRKAASLVGHGESIILDCGATTTEMAKQLTEREGLRVVTNALNIAMILGAKPSNRIMLPGGLFKPETLSVTDEKASTFFAGMYADKLFLAAGGVAMDAGLSYPDFIDLHVKRAMIEAANRVYLVADSSKFGRRDFAAFGAMEAIDVLVTDRALEPRYLGWLQQLGIEVIYAD